MLLRRFFRQAKNCGRAARQAAEGIQLAQYGDVEIYYDEFGRRVVVDAYTGEVICGRASQAHGTPAAP